MGSCSTGAGGKGRNLKENLKLALIVDVNLDVSFN